MMCRRNSNFSSHPSQFIRCWEISRAGTQGAAPGLIKIFHDLLFIKMEVLQSWCYLSSQAALQSASNYEFMQELANHKSLCDIVTRLHSQYVFLSELAVEYQQFLICQACETDSLAIHRRKEWHNSVSQCLYRLRSCVSFEHFTLPDRQRGTKDVADLDVVMLVLTSPRGPVFWRKSEGNR